MKPERYPDEVPSEDEEAADQAWKAAEKKKAGERFDATQLGLAFVNAAKANKTLSLQIRYEGEHHRAFVKTIQLLDGVQKARQAANLQTADANSGDKSEEDGESDGESS